MVFKNEQIEPSNNKVANGTPYLVSFQLGSNNFNLIPLDRLKKRHSDSPQNQEHFPLGSIIKTVSS